MDDTPMDEVPMDDDQTLYVPEAFEREHLDDARRAVANSRGARAAARRVTAATTSTIGRTGRSRLGIVILIHALAALFVVTIAIATGTWAVGGVLLVLVASSLAVVSRVLHVLAIDDAPQPAQPPTPRPNPRHPR